jgi:hypothetical protein
LFLFLLYFSKEESAGGYWHIEEGFSWFESAQVVDHSLAGQLGHKPLFLAQYWAWYLNRVIEMRFISGYNKKKHRIAE